MKEILDFKLCKRLYEAGVRVETEYMANMEGFRIITTKEYEANVDYGIPMMFWFPALTIVDGLELMKVEIEVLFFSLGLWYIKLGEEYEEDISGVDIKECVEKALIYLLDNNLLGQNIKN